MDYIIEQTNGNEFNSNGIDEDVIIIYTTS